MPQKCRNLVLIMGDQLNRNSTALAEIDPLCDRVLMVEALQEATYIPQHKQRLVLFFSGLRHFRDALRTEGLPVTYRGLHCEPHQEDARSFLSAIGDEVARSRPERLVVSHPGDFRVLESIKRCADELDLVLEVRDDVHFIDSLDAFNAFVHGRKALRLEHYYRHLRRREKILLDGNEPAGGKWNFDADNRERLNAKVALTLPPATGIAPDTITRDVMSMVARRFPDAPGNIEQFDHPVTPEDARVLLDRFCDERLGLFGRYQDAMVDGYAYLNHSRLSVALNLHLIDPRDVIDAAVARLDVGAPLNSVEGFVRQVLGWREYVRGIYWRQMPGYMQMNALEATAPMPRFMWTAQTDMRCVSDGVTHLLDYGYTHHIQRLMVLGQFAMLLGVQPYDVHRWHMSMYIDAVDWVSLPNVLGMSQYGDGGVVGSKPYAASGSYIKRMSNYCSSCRYNPARATGEDACPFTTLYWDFLDRHYARLKSNPRMSLQFKNLTRKNAGEMNEIRAHAEHIRINAAMDTYLQD